MYISDEFKGIQATLREKFQFNSLEQDVSFVSTGCYFPDKLTVGVTDTSGHLQIVNNGSSGTCLIAFEIKGEYYLLWEGILDGSQGGTIDLTVTMNKESFPETAAVTFTFYCGYPGPDPNTMIPTDSWARDVLVVVPRTDWVQYAIIGGIAAGVLLMLISIMKKPRGEMHYG